MAETIIVILIVIITLILMIRYYVKRSLLAQSGCNLCKQNGNCQSCWLNNEEFLKRNTKEE